MDQRFEHNRLIGGYDGFGHGVLQPSDDFNDAHVGAGQDKRLRVGAVEP